MDRLKSGSINYSQGRLLAWLNIPFLLIVFVLLAFGLGGLITSIGTVFGHFEYKGFLIGVLLIAISALIIFLEVGFIRIGYTSKGVKKENRFWHICIAFFAVMLFTFLYISLITEVSFYKNQPLQVLAGTVYLLTYIIASTTALRNIRKNQMQNS